MNNLMIFEGRQVEVFELNGQVLFNPKDVAECLEIADVNSSTRKFNEKQIVKLNNSDMHDMHIRKLNNAGENFLTESGVYKLIFKSHKPDAEKFQDWVTDEVLPTIRKHGAYMTTEKIEEVLLNPDVIINLATQLKQERELNEKLDLTVRSQEKQIEELKPLAAYVKTILNNKSLVTVEQIAQDYGISAQKLNKTLHELHIQYKGGNGQWILYQAHKPFGYVHSETISFKRSDGRPDSNMHTKWTQKGRMFLYEKLKEQGILPLIERELEGKAI